MGKHFANVRKKTRLAAILTAVILGIGVGALTIAAIVLTMKLTGKPITLLYYLSGIPAMLVSSAVSYFVFMPSDKRLAKRLDEEHKLNEKVRTMIEFKNSDSAFNQLQREDADEKLGKIKFTPWRKKQLISALLVFVISAASLTTAFVIPGKAETVEPEKPLTEFDKQWILTELADIINIVDKSLMSENLKADSLVSLRSLVTFVEEHEYLSEMKLEAIKTVISVNSGLKKENTAPVIGEKLSAGTNEALKALGAELVKLNGTAAQKKLNELKDSIKSQTLDGVSFAADELSSAIVSSGADASNSFTVLLSNLASALRGYANQEVASIDEAFGTVASSVMTQTMVQSLNKMTVQTVISRLCALFGITQEDINKADSSSDIDVNPPAENPPDKEDDSVKDDSAENIGSGGVGTGDRIYGSNDMIYNPYKNEYVPYGQVYDEYNAKVLQMIQDGRIPPEFEEFTKEYFRSLSEYNPED